MEKQVSRLAVSLLGVGVFLLLALLYGHGSRELYSAIIRIWGVVPFAYPFLDGEGPLAAWDCSRAGIDVVVADPCDVLKRGFPYGPFWMSFDWLALGRSDRVGFGLACDLAFILSLALLPRPLSRGDLGVRILACFSTMVVFALERSNPDILLFVLVVLLLSLIGRSPPAKAVGYALVLVAGMLKYYPFALLLLPLRERPRVAVAVTLATGFGVALFYLHYARQIGEGMSHIPRGSPFGDLFGLRNLPFGLYTLLRAAGRQPLASAQVATASALILLAAVVGAMVRLRRAVGLADALGRLDEPRRLSLVAGALLISGCFLTGQSVGYRGVFLLLLIPGLYRLSIDRNGGAVVAGSALLAVPALMWGEALRLWIHVATSGSLASAESKPAYPENIADVALWFVREVMWWLLVGFLVTIVVEFVMASPLVRAMFATPRSALSSEHRT